MQFPLFVLQRADVVVVVELLCLELDAVSFYLSQCAGVIAAVEFKCVFVRIVLFKFDFIFN